MSRVANDNRELARLSVRERLSHWDTQLASLSELQKDCFIELSSTAANRAIPEHVSVFKSQCT